MSEMAPASVRGRLSGLNQTMIVSGMLLSYIAAWFLQHLPEQWAWRSMLALAALPAVILFLGVLRLPESPRYLYKKDDVEGARRVLTYIREPEEIDEEMANIRQILESESHAEQTSTLQLFSLSLIHISEPTRPAA